MSADQAVTQRQHPGVRGLLPFFVNRTLSEIENARVMRHVASCASCHEALDGERRLQDLMRAAPEPASDAEAAWARLERTLDVESRAGRRWVRPAWISGLGLAAAAALVVMLTPVVLIEPDRGAADYHTLTSPTPGFVPGSWAIHVIFEPQATVGEIEGLLDRTGMQIAGGPTARGVYLLTPAASGNAASGSAARDALAILHDSPLVALAAPAAGPAGP